MIIKRKKTIIFIMLLFAMLIITAPPQTSSNPNTAIPPPALTLPRDVSSSPEPALPPDAISPPVIAEAPAEAPPDPPPPEIMAAPPVVAELPATASASDTYIPPEVRVLELAAAVTDENGVDNAWALWLINAKNPFPKNYVPALTDGGGFRLDYRCAEYARLMIEAARNDGIYLNVVSAYRSIERQTTNFVNFYDDLVHRGLAKEDAFEETISQIAAPYTSEHNAGLAMDIGIIEFYFDQTAEYRWLVNNSLKYGFIMRYPADKTDITEIIYEPWHYRFVGLYHAERIYNSGLCLEEYMNDDGTDNDVNNVVAAFKESVTGISESPVLVSSEF